MDVDDSLCESLDISPRAGVDIERDACDVVGPAAAVDVGDRRRQVEPEGRIGVQVPVEDRAGAGGLKGGVVGNGQPDLDVAVQHRGWRSRLPRIKLGLTAEPARA